MSNYDELVERLEDKLPELDRRARLADISVNNAADALDAAAGRDAQAEVATIRQAAAAIRALEGEIERLRGLLPEGFVAVPREPTEAMIEAACNAGPFSCDDARDIYRAMIQAQEKQG